MSFIVGENFSRESGGFVVVGAHTDSPCVRIRPNNDVASEGYRMLSVETYGGADERTAFKINKESHLRPVLCSEIKRLLADTDENKVPPIQKLLATEVGCTPDQIIDLDVCLMDATDSRLAGIYEEFVESPRIDNLASTWAAMTSISEITPNQIAASSDVMVAIAWDHEEVGKRVPIWGS
ncbi:aspartyl aminopeptidase-like [Condylostylus longicornis]|uniref:aspartyl aminopeptidase-like n=1 Tax=Condylostylus longicornis TaxID=2530218 RepID=UPI00244E3EEB|nr:aspartyl aminopeptidase-like [Condylostylus longicornis]